MRQMKDSGIEWIGKIPDDWHIEKIKFNVLNRNEKSDAECHYPYVALENIEGFTGKYIETENSYDVSQANIARCGDVLFGKLRPYLAKVFVASYNIFVSGEFAVLCTQKLCNVYLKWFILSHGFLDIVNSSAYGTKMPRVNVDFIKNCYITIFPKKEQQKIANFLDDKCAKIDSLIAHEEAIIEELKAYKQSVITEAVTKGLVKYVPMKDSGVEWIGKIPAGWLAGKLKNVCEIFGRIGFRGYRQDDLVNEGEGTITLSPSNMKDMKMNYEKCSYLTWEKYFESPEIQIKNNDILFVKTGSTFGKVALVENLPLEATINPQIIVITNFKILNKYGS